MTEWLYLASGFGLLLTLLQKESRPGDSAPLGTFSLQLLAALAVLVMIDTFTTLYLWRPLGRNDLRFISLFLWGVVADEGAMRLGKRGERRGRPELVVNPSLLALLAISFWIVSKEGVFPYRIRILAGFSLVPAAALFEWLLTGLQRRLKLSLVPKALEGLPILFWTAMILSLAFLGFSGLHS